MAAAARSWLLGGDAFPSSAAVSDESSYLSAAFPSRRGGLAVSTLRADCVREGQCVSENVHRLDFFCHRFASEGESSRSRPAALLERSDVLSENSN